jgi:hypothetical protein
LASAWPTTFGTIAGSGAAVVVVLSVVVAPSVVVSFVVVADGAGRASATLSRTVDPPATSLPAGGFCATT